MVDWWKQSSRSIDRSLCKHPPFVPGTWSMRRARSNQLGAMGVFFFSPSLKKNPASWSNLPVLATLFCSCHSKNHDPIRTLDFVSNGVRFPSCKFIVFFLLSQKQHFPSSAHVERRKKNCEQYLQSNRPDMVNYTLCNKAYKMASETGRPKPKLHRQVTSVAFTSLKLKQSAEMYACS